MYWSKCQIPPASAGIDAQTKSAIESIKKTTSDIMYVAQLDFHRKIVDFLSDFSEEIHIPDDLIQRLEPLKPHIDVISIEKGGARIDTHIYISLQRRFKQPWNITLDTWRKAEKFTVLDVERKKTMELVKFMFDLPSILEKEMQNLATFFSLPRSEQKKWMDFRQTYGTPERKGITPEIQKMIDEV